MIPPRRWTERRLVSLLEDYCSQKTYKGLTGTETFASSFKGYPFLQHHCQ